MKALKPEALTGKDIVGIIRAGRQAKVAIIELYGLKIIYHGADQAASGSPYLSVLAPDPQSSGEPGQSKPETKPDLTELMITDPAAFEAEILRE